MKTNKGSIKRFVIILLASIVLIVILALLGMKSFSPKTSLSGISPDTAYAEGYNAARAKMALSCPFINQSMNSFGATVISVNANGLIVHQDSLIADPKADGIPNEREIRITSETKIARLSPKDPTLLNKEFQDFQKLQISAFQGTSTPADIPRPPSSFMESSLKLSDLKAGDRISITSDKDARFEKTIVAINIEMVEPTQSPPTPSAPAQTTTTR